MATWYLEVHACFLKERDITNMALTKGTPLLTRIIFKIWNRSMDKC